MNDTLLQLAVSSVLQFGVLKSGKFLQDCKDCRLQNGVPLCRN